jgi:hypothetical protein
MNKQEVSDIMDLALRKTTLGGFKEALDSFKDRYQTGDDLAAYVMKSLRESIARDDWVGAELYTT